MEEIHKEKLSTLAALFLSLPPDIAAAELMNFRKEEVSLVSYALTFFSQELLESEDEESVEPNRSAAEAEFIEALIMSRFKDQIEEYPDGLAGLLRERLLLDELVELFTEEVAQCKADWSELPYIRRAAFFLLSLGRDLALQVTGLLSPQGDKLFQQAWSDADCDSGEMRDHPSRHLFMVAARQEFLEENSGRLIETLPPDEIACRMEGLWFPVDPESFLD